MCSFGITNIAKDISHFNFFNQKRGPDITKIEKIKGITFLHNLLHITGDIVEQPFVTEDIVCTFNGEIYNFKDFGDYKSDGECIIPLYNRYGIDFAKKLDGEFAICIVDFKKSYLVIINDTFSTKPVWFAKGKNFFGVSTYASVLRGLGFKKPQKLPGNRLWCFDLKTLDGLKAVELKKFDLEQHKEDYNDWNAAFSKSIKKRVVNTPHKIFMGLSAGYDSGLIASELIQQEIDFKAYTILSEEDVDTINKRHSLLKNGEIISLSKEEFLTKKEELRINCEDFIFKDKYKNYDIKKDKASVGLAKICSNAKAEGYRIYFSGQGSDEIISDYGWNGEKIYDHSSFGGKFPKNLEGFFPWHSFFGGTQIQYLNKEEYVAGSYGIETRYPFLDVELVQEFLWLSASLKNKIYKAPIAELLSRRNYPFQQGVKTGFQADRNLK